jgi:hypothetical protein
LRYVEDLRATVEAATPRLLALGERSGFRPSPVKWSPKEILGHLVDSASNSHQRFVRAQLQEDLVFPGYAQDDWVRIGCYADAPWEDLVLLWRTFNLQLARVMEHTPLAERDRPRPNHNFDAIGVPLAPGASASLECLMVAYVAHLRHHLAQIFKGEFCNDS